MTSIEEQVARLTDRAQIHDLLLSYARCADTRDWQGYSDLFAEEGRIVWPYGDILKKDIARSIERILEPYEGTHHLFANIGITIDGDTAPHQSLSAGGAHSFGEGFEPAL